MAHTCLCAYTFKEKQQKTQYRTWCPALGAHPSEVSWEIWLDGTDHDIAYSKNADDGSDVHILYNGSVTWTFDCKSFKKLEANESNIYNNANRLLKNCQKLFMIYIAK